MQECKHGSDDHMSCAECAVGLWELVEYPIVGEGKVAQTGPYEEIETKFIELCDDPEVDEFYVEMRPVAAQED